MKECGGLPNCYTLECNYATGKRINYISTKQVVKTKEVEAETEMTNSKSKFYLDSNRQGRQAPVYTVEVFEDVGRAFCVALLDFHKCNPVSRLPTSWYKNLEGVKNDIIAKSGIYIPKPKTEDIIKKSFARNPRQEPGK